jgi:hypothetical protein
VKKHLTYTLALFTLICTSAHAQLPSYLPADGLVGWWPFNGNANDESGNGNDGVVNGATLASDRDGVVNAAYSFDGINDFILSNNFDLIQGNVSRSFSFWVKYSNLDIGGWVISYGPQGYDFPCNDEYHIEAKMIADCNFPGVGVGVPCSQKRFEFLLNDDQWRNFTVVYDGTGLANTKLYVNGVLHTDNYCVDNVGVAAELATNVVSGGISFGKRNDNLGFLDGTLDDIAIYNRALTSQEIQNLYTGTTPAACLDLPANLQDGLVGYWPFCGNANDESGNGNNGNVNGATLAEDRFGNAGSAYSFQTDARIVVSDNMDLRLANTDFTMSAWILLNDTLPTDVNYGGYIILSKRDFVNETYDYLFGVSAPSYTVDWGAGKPFISTSNIPGNYAVAPEAVILQEWVNVVATYSLTGGVLKVFVDGNLVSATNGAQTPESDITSDLWIGNDVAESPYHFHGLLDDITIYNRALSPEEVTQLYAVQSTGDPTAGGGGNTTGPLANVPRGISYQAVARDAQGEAIANTPVNVRFTLHQGTPTGTTEYSETHALTTNAIGLFSTYFGSGTAVTSAFDSIVWSNTTKFLQVEIDLGNGYVDMGTQQLMSVPYAYRANEAAAAGTIRNAALPIYPDNTAALAGGLVAGEMYRTATGDLKVVY